MAIGAEFLQDVHSGASGATIALGLGVGPAAGHLAAACRTANGWLSLDRVRVVAPGLPTLALKQESAWTTGQSDESTSHEVWSRTIGALGENAWRRLRELRIVVVGCGRTGSLLSASLRRMPVKEITLIDADRVEPHNLGEMEGVDLDDLRRTKVAAVADHLRRQRLPGPAAIETVPESVLSLSALVAIKRADWVFCCVDHAAARLATAFLAALYLKPMIDIGTGILQEGAQRVMGASVRLVEPGRCLLCLGGVADLQAARETLLRPPAADPPAAQPQDFRQQRAGSLRSLNQLGVGLAVRLLEEYMQGALQGSAWLQWEMAPGGVGQLQQREADLQPNCPLCRAAGGGDDALPRLQSMVSSLL